MQSVLITGGSADAREKKAEEICDELHVERLETSIFRPPEEKTDTEEAFGIALIRRIKQRAYLRPSLGTTQAILIFEADQLTLTAQHALLKLLEEPPDHTIIMVAAGNKYSVLATIRSRCKIISLQEISANSDAIEENEFPSDFSIKQALLLSEKIAKSNPKVWMTKYIATLHTLFVRQATHANDLSGIFHTKKLLSKLQDAYILLTTSNTNSRLVLEHFLSDIS
ncbi:MAG: hypothetical protein Q8Q49_03820 [bacterium]|nr:hypothetical protein [bacterium]